MILHFTGLDGPYIYKVCFQLLFAFCGVITYAIAARLMSRDLALVAAIFFVSFPTFFTDMPFLNRQEIAFLFCGCCFLLFLIDAVTDLASTGHALPQVVIAGEPAVRRGIFRVFQARNQRYLDGLKARVYDAGLDAHVTFVGHVPDDTVFALFTLADVVVLPYLVVDQSGVLNIAIAAHTPVIANDIGGLGETLADVGIVVAPGLSTALTRELDRVLASPDLRARLRDAYGRMAEDLSTDNVAAAMLEDYRAMCWPRPRRVVQVSAFYAPHLGGQESVVDQLSRALGPYRHGGGRRLLPVAGRDRTLRYNTRPAPVGA
jgi:hypothetical protein